MSSVKEQDETRFCAHCGRDLERRPVKIARFAYWCWNCPSEREFQTGEVNAALDEIAARVRAERERTASPFPFF